MRLKCKGCSLVFLGAEISGMELQRAAKVLSATHYPRCGGGPNQLFLTSDEAGDPSEPRRQRTASENGDDMADVPAKGTPNDGDSW